MADQICRRFTWHRLIKKSIRCANTIGAVIVVSNILTPLCLVNMTSPNFKAVASGNGNRLFTEKRYVQIANNPRFPQCQTEAEYYVLPDPSHFSLPSTFHTTPTVIKSMCRRTLMFFIKL